MERIIYLLHYVSEMVIALLVMDIELHVFTLRMRIQRFSSRFLPFAQVHRVNSAFDFLSKFFHSQPCHHYISSLPRKELNTDAVFSKGLLCSLASGVGIGAASYQNPDFREEMQDAMVYQDCFGQVSSK